MTEDQPALVAMCDDYQFVQCRSDTDAVYKQVLSLEKKCFAKADSWRGVRGVSHVSPGNKKASSRRLPGSAPVTRRLEVPAHLLHPHTRPLKGDMALELRRRNSFIICMTAKQSQHVSMSAPLGSALWAGSPSWMLERRSDALSHPVALHKLLCPHSTGTSIHTVQHTQPDSPHCTAGSLSTAPTGGSCQEARPTCDP